MHAECRGQAHLTAASGRPATPPAQVRDLLSKDPTARLELRESPERGVHVRGLREFVVKSAAEMASVLEVGWAGLG